MRYIMTVIGAVFTVPLVMLKKAFEVNVRHHELETVSYEGDVPFRLFFISDIHRRTIPDRLIEEAGYADAVIIGGDLAEKGVPLERIQSNIDKLSKIGQIYYVWGNNDREVGEHHIREIIQGANGILIENEALAIRKNKGKVWLVGIDDVSSGRADIAKSFIDVPTNEPVVFISHTPFVFSKVKRLYKTNLLLAGHTHGGQIRLGKIGYYEKGSFQKDQLPAVLVSNGFGTTFVPLRFGAPAESHIISIHRRNS